VARPRGQAHSARPSAAGRGGAPTRSALWLNHLDCRASRGCRVFELKLQVFFTAAALSLALCRFPHWHILNFCLMALGGSETIAPLSDDPFVKLPAVAA
jgi:hypothetical protein